MASQSKKRKCKNTAYDRGGEKGKVHRFKGYAMYHKKDRVAANKEAVIDEEDVQSIRRGRWIYDGDCMITSCCNTAYDINKFECKEELILVPCKCPNCDADMRGESNE